VELASVESGLVTPVEVLRERGICLSGICECGIRLSGIGERGIGTGIRWQCSRVSVF
jgi:hypothetical protein